MQVFCTTSFTHATTATKRRRAIAAIVFWFVSLDELELDDDDSLSFIVRTTRKTQDGICKDNKGKQSERYLTLLRTAEKNGGTVAFQQCPNRAILSLLRMNR